MRLVALTAATLVLATGATLARAGELVLDAGATRAPVVAYGTTRDALTVAAGTEARGRVDAVPTGARLLTAIAVPERPPTADAAEALRFRITFDGDGGSVPLYERVLDRAAAADRRWVDVGVPLDAVAGRTGTFRFAVTSARGAAATTTVVATPAAAASGAATAPAGLFAPPTLVVCDGTTPSLLLVTIDALRADHLGSYGYARRTTPFLDAFAADATRFTSAYTGGPKTIPSIPQILTGHYFYWHRPTRGLATLLGASGPPSRAIVNNPWVAGWLRGERPGFDAVEAGDALDARAITSAALRWLTTAGRCPTALYLHYLDTHTPYHAPPRFARRFVDRRAATTIGLAWDDVTRAWQNGYGAADRQRIVDLYDGSLAYTDRELGRLVRGLARRGRLEHTLVIVTADHGEELWDHGKFFHGQSLYDELLHVPLVVRFPDVGHGRVVDALVRSVDLVPTVAETTGHPAPTGDGTSLRALAAGADEPSERTAFALVSHAEPRTPERQAVRTRTRKLVHDVSDGALQVYDLVADPKEKRNLGPAAPGADALVALLGRFRAGLDGAGYRLRVRGVPDRAVRYAIDVATDPPAPVIAIDRRDLEPGDLVDFAPHASGFAVHGTVAAGDEDGVRFDVLAASGSLRVAIRLDDAPAADGTLLLGSSATPAGAIVDLARAPLDGVPPAATSPTRAPIVELWRAAPTTGNAAPTLDDATRARLRQLGYVE